MTPLQIFFYLWLTENYIDGIAISKPRNFGRESSEMEILILGKNWRLVTSSCTNIQYLFYTAGLQEVKPLQLWDMIPGKTGKVNKARGFYG